jgi:hypothetical protein
MFLYAPILPEAASIVKAIVSQAVVSRVGRVRRF